MTLFSHGARTLEGSGARGRHCYGRNTIGGSQSQPHKRSPLVMRCACELSSSIEYPIDSERLPTSRPLSHASLLDNLFPLKSPHSDSSPPSGLPIAYSTSPFFPIVVTFSFSHSHFAVRSYASIPLTILPLFTTLCFSTSSTRLPVLLVGIRLPLRSIYFSVVHAFKIVRTSAITVVGISTRSTLFTRSFKFPVRYPPFTHARASPKSNTLREALHSSQ